jgi:hypothetical protein
MSQKKLMRYTLWTVLEASQLPRILNRSETKKFVASEQLRVLFCYFIGTSSFPGHHVVFLRLPSPVCVTTKCCCFSSFWPCVSGIYEAFLFAKFFNQEHCDFLHVNNRRICFFVCVPQYCSLAWFCGFAFHRCFLGRVVLALCAMQFFIFLETTVGHCVSICRCIVHCALSFFFFFVFLWVHFTCIVIF